MDDYDVIIVGARVAGASTALLLARAGHRVLVLDRARRGSDTLSTHALMPPAVLQLERWGLLDDVIAGGTPGHDRVVFHYGDRQVRLQIARELYAPRRTLLDPLLVGAAEASGATVRFGVDVRELLRDPDGAVTGVRVRDESGRTEEIHATTTVGADGRRSGIAAQLRPPVTRASTATSAFLYRYVTDVDTDAFEWCYRPGSTAGVIPTSEGQACVFIGVPPDRFAAELRHDPPAGFVRVLAETSPDVARRVAAGRPSGHVRAFPGLPGWLRRPWGDGWALVGDAGYFKDPATAHGISDALRDAELLADALDATITGASSASEALAGYERVRDELAIEFFELTDAIASFTWSLEEAQRLHLAMSDVMKREVAVLTRLRVSRDTAVA